jgi:hypothetical protein
MVVKMYIQLVILKVLFKIKKNLRYNYYGIDWKIKNLRPKNKKYFKS